MSAYEQWAMLSLVQSRYEQMHVEVNVGAGLLWLVTAPFFALGWLIGFLWRCLLWCVAAIIIGFQSGRGA